MGQFIILPLYYILLPKQNTPNTPGAFGAGDRLWLGRLSELFLFAARRLQLTAASCFNHKVLDHGFLRNLNTKQKGCRKQITRLTGYWLDLELVLLVGWYSQIRFLHIPALKEAVLESLVVEKGSSKIRCSNSSAFRSYQKFRYLVQWAPCQGLWMKADGDPKSSWDLLTS